MGICCSKIDNLNEVSSFNGARHPSLEQWQAARSSCQFCQAKGAATDHLQCCTCETCQRAASYGVEGLVNGRSYHEPMCNLCAADVYDAHIHHQAPYVSSWSSGVSDEDDSATHYDLIHREHTRAHSHAPSIERSLMQGSLVNANTVQHEMLKQNRTFDHTFLGVDVNRTLVDSNRTIFEYKDEIYASGTLTFCTKGDQGPLGSYEAACEIMGNSRRLSNIDDSDGIKLEVRYKHMLPHDVHIPAPHHDANGLKRARPQEEQLLTEDDPKANRSIRRRKSFQIPSLDEDDLSLCSLDELDNDDNFHDFTVGVSVGSFDSFDKGKDQPNTELCHSLDIFSHFHDNVPMQAQDVECIPDYVGFTRSDPTVFDDQPLYVMSQENLQFITRKEREWEERAHGLGMEEEKICSKMQALSVVSTGDAILFSGADSDELHLFPSVTVQHQKSPLSSPKHKLGPGRIVSPERYDEQAVMAAEKSPLSIEGIINLLENDEISEDDLFSLLIDSCTKSSETSSPTSSTESTNSWSSLLSSSSSSSSSSASSSSASSMPSLSPLSSTSVLQLPPSSTTYSLTLPYSLSLPPSCKMSPHTSFEFKVKSCGSTPSTPVFSPIRSRSKRNIMHMKPSALTAEEIAEIWGVFEQRQAFISQQCMRK